MSPKNLVTTRNIGKVKAGIETFQFTFRNGKQVWVEAIKGKITNVGSNVLLR
jgi:hypothetical protein